MKIGGHLLLVLKRLDGKIKYPNQKGTAHKDNNVVFQPSTGLLPTYRKSFSIINQEK